MAIDEAGAAVVPGAAPSVGATVVYYAFDMLQIDGRDLTREPLDVRRQQLARRRQGHVDLVSEPLPGTPAQIERAVRELGLEGRRRQAPRLALRAGHGAATSGSK